MSSRYVRDSVVVAAAMVLALGIGLQSTKPAHADSVVPVDTVKEWCAAKADDPSNKRYLCIFYLRGILDGLVLQAAMTKTKPIFCITEKNNFEYGILPEFFNAYVAEHPASERTEMAGVAFARALVARMPCK